MTQDKNPPAFPFAAEYGHPAAHGGMSLRDWFAGTAPEPSDAAINHEHSMDRARNPYNEPYHNKPPIRSRTEIIAALRYAYADAMLAARSGEPA